MPAYADLYVLPAIDKMRKLYPDLEFDLNITDQTLSLSSNDADIAIRATSDLPEQVVARQLSKHNFILVASPDFINQNGKPQTSDDLNLFPIFMYRTPRGVLNWQAQKNQTWKDIELTPKYVSNHGQSLLESVVSGQGIALLPSWGVAKEISTGQLQEIELKDGRLSTSGDLKMNMYLLYHPPKFQLKKIRLTVDFLYRELNLLSKITT
jgi:DNA-binding transcriptional LysR family regulator